MDDPGNADDCRQEWDGAEKTVAQPHEQRLRVEDASPNALAAVRVADAVAHHREEPPLRVFFGKIPLSIATKDYESRLATWNTWQPLAEEAQG